MKLILTSTGLKTPELLDQARQALPKTPADCTAALISLTAPEDQHFVEEAKQEIIDLGITHILDINMREPVDVEHLPAVDLIYMCGGNTFRILNKLRETGLEQFVKNQVQRGALYVGVSAGSILAGLDIQIAGWGSQPDENDIGLKDLRAFGFTEVATAPHFLPQQKEEVDAFGKKFERKVVPLADGEGVVLEV